MSDQDRRYLPDAPTTGEVISAEFLRSVQDVARDPLIDVTDRALELELDPDKDPEQEPAQSAESETETPADEDWKELSRRTISRRVFQNNDPSSTNWVDVDDAKTVTLVNIKTGVRRTDRYDP